MARAVKAIQGVVALGLALAALGGGVTACSGTDATADDSADNEDALTKGASFKALVAGNNAFATDLYGQLTSGKDNVFFSPYSISAALSMTYAGAKGQTASAMKETLHLPGTNVHTAFKSLAGALAKRTDTKGAAGDGFKLSIANSLWGDSAQSFKSSFTSIVSKNYGAGLELADFVHKPDAERGRINDWVANETNDKIQNLLPQGSITSDTRLVLVDAIYFKASWATTFKTSATVHDKFSALGGGKKDVEMMHDTGHYAYAGGASYDAVAIPYVGEQVELVAIAPKAGTFDTFESSFDAAKLDSIRSEMEETRIELGFPKFKIDGASIALKDTLSKLGMGVAFSDQADLSGITGQNDNKIGDVVHQAFVAVDEKGTEAAAATAVLVVAKTAVMTPPPRVTFDRPFIFAIRDVPTGALLFLGRITKP